uniref:Uncharacterized protein n=1 Tax=Romanomermis culicivorax TaxID=13658 RepID=A0A915KE12_ROMCU
MRELKRFSSGSAKGQIQIKWEKYVISADSKSDIYDTSSVMDNENNKSFLMIKFKRKLDTKDSNQDKSLSNCLKFLYPVWPGKINGNGQFSMHTRNPLVSVEDMCLANCSDLPQNGSSNSPLQGEQKICEFDADQPANGNVPNQMMTSSPGPSATNINAQSLSPPPSWATSPGSSMMMPAASPTMAGSSSSSVGLMGSAVMATTLAAVGGSTMMMMNQSRSTMAPAGVMPGNAINGTGGGTASGNATAGNQTAPGNSARFGREGDVVLYTAALSVILGLIWQF